MSQGLTDGEDAAQDDHQFIVRARFQGRIQGGLYGFMFHS